MYYYDRSIDVAKVQATVPRSANSFCDGFAKSFDVPRPRYSDTDLQLGATEKEEPVANCTSEGRTNDIFLIESLYIYKVERAGNCAMNFLIITEESTMQPDH